MKTGIGKRPSNLRRQFIFAFEPAIGHVAGDQHDVGPRLQRGDGVESALRHHVGFGHPIGGHARRAKMQVGDLGDEHGYESRNELQE